MKITKFNARIFPLRFWLGGLLTASLLSGCAFRSARPDAPPEALALAREGDAAYVRMAFPEAWGAYQRARALGVRDGVLLYRLWILGEVLKKKRPAEEVSSLQKQAFQLLSDAHQRPPGRPAVYFYLAQLLRETGKEGAAGEARLYAEAVRHFEAGVFRELGAMDLELLARMYTSLGLLDRAERLYAQALEREPRSAFAVYGRARLYQRSGQPARAIAEWERFAALVPQDPEGFTRMGEAAQAAGEWAKALKAFGHAIALDSTNASGRRGFRRSKELVERHEALRKSQKTLTWEVGFQTRLSPLTLPEDELRLAGEGLGPPAFGPEGTLAFASGGRERFSLYTVSPDGVSLVRRFASTEGFTAFTEGKESLVVAVGSGPRRSVRTFDLLRGDVHTVFRGECSQPQYVRSTQALLCKGPEGVTLRHVASQSQKPAVVLRGPGGRHPRLGRDGQTVVLADGGEVILYDLSGRELGRVLPGNQDAAAGFPDISPDEKWIVSGEEGLQLTSLTGKFTVRLNHPELRGAARATFSPDGRGLALVKDGRLFRLELPEQLEVFAAMLRAEELLDAGHFGLAARFLNARPAAERARPFFHLLLARAYAGLRLYQEAEAAVRRAEELDPPDWRPHLWMGRLRAAQGDWKGALGRLGQAIRMAPARFEGYFERARASFSLGRSSEAISDFQEALRRLGGHHPGRDVEGVVQGLLDAYVKEKKINEALILLLDHGKSLSPAADRRVRTDPAYLILHSDPRFRGVLGRPVSGVSGETRP